MFFNLSQKAGRRRVRRSVRKGGSKSARSVGGRRSVGGGAKLYHSVRRVGGRRSVRRGRFLQTKKKWAVIR